MFCLVTQHWSVVPFPVEAFGKESTNNTIGMFFFVCFFLAALFSTTYHFSQQFLHPFRREYRWQNKRQIQSIDWPKLCVKVLAKNLLDFELSLFEVNILCHGLREARKKNRINRMKLPLLLFFSMALPPTHFDSWYNRICHELKTSNWHHNRFSSHNSWFTMRTEVHRKIELFKVVVSMWKKESQDLCFTTLLLLSTSATNQGIRKYKNSLCDANKITCFRWFHFNAYRNLWPHTVHHSSSHNHRRWLLTLFELH